MESYFEENIIAPRLGDGTLIGYDKVDDSFSSIYIRMRGYAIIPVEDYLALLPVARREQYFACSTAAHTKKYQALLAAKLSPTSPLVPSS